MGFVAAAILVGVIAAPAAAQQDPEQRIAAALERAREAGLPAQLLQSKINEGRAKGVSAERIAIAVEQRAAALDRASQVLAEALGAEAVTEQDIGVGADALQAGVTEHVLAAVAKLDGSATRRTVALAALAYLTGEGGVIPEEAASRIQEAMTRGDAALMNLPAAARGPGAAGPPAGVPAAGRPSGAGKPGGKPGGGF